MISKSNNDRSQCRSSAELSQGQTSLDDTKEQERTAHSSRRRNASQYSGHDGNGDSRPNGIGTSYNRSVKRSLSGGIPKGVIVFLTSICARLLLLLAALVNKIGSAHSMSPVTEGLCLCSLSVRSLGQNIGQLLGSAALSNQGKVTDILLITSFLFVPSYRC